jgi:hypothetical protein
VRGKQIGLRRMDVIDLSGSFEGTVCVLRELANQRSLAALIEDALDPSPIRVTVDGSGLSWEERAIRVECALWSTMAQSCVTQLVTQLMGAPISRMMAWSNCYATGEWIPWHKDACGDIQMLLVLSEASTNSGGLWLESRSGPRRMPLWPGDGLLFEAARITHETSATDSPTPRITAAMRFFAAQA